MGFFELLFASSGFQPHGFCYQWNSGLVWLNVLSDFSIALAYFTIPITLVWFIRKRRDLPFGWMFGLFGVFIVACGMTHAMEVWNLWHAQYWLAGAIKAVTAAASIPTAILLGRIVPRALALPTSRQWMLANAALQKEVEGHRETELELRVSESHYRESADLLDLTHDAIFVRDARDVIVFWNRAAERLYGWRKEEIRGRTSHGLLQTVFPKPLKEIEAELNKTGLWEGELIHRRRDGSTVIVSSRWALRGGANGKASAVLESNRDLTQRIRDERKFRDLLEAAPDAMILANKEGRIELANAQVDAIFGYTKAELIGQPVETLLPERYRQKHGAHRTEYFHAPNNREMGAGLELYGLRKDGTEFPVEVSLSPLETADGTLVISAIRDITLRKGTEEALRQSEERARLLVSGVEDYAILLLDREGRVVTWNAGAERIKGYQADEILGEHFSKFYPTEDIEKGKPDWELKIAAEQGSVKDEGWRLRKDGTRFWANVLITALHDEKGRLRGFGKITRDITERKETEEALERHRNELARSNAEMSAANKELEAFSYSVSHDLRAPLRTIDGFSHALLEDCADQLDDTGKSHLNRIRAATQRMGLLIDDLLNLSRLSRTPMHIQRVDISAMASSIADDLQKGQPERQVALRIEGGLTTSADPGLLRAVLENLLSNAWKFTSKLTFAHIELGRTKANREQVFFVRDDGAGFDPAYADRLFGAFQRLHAMTEFSGTGVGLATVQRIINRHGGRIWAESAVGRGATFYFTMGEKAIEGERDEKQLDYAGRR